jgi:hypothetical protein
MSDKKSEIEDHSETENDTTGEFSLTEHSDRSAGHSRHRRRRKSTKAKSGSRILPAIGVIVSCALLVGVGVLLGSSREATIDDDERSRITLENRLKLHQQWLAECAESGHSDWTCAHFDRAHFEAAKSLDHFSCENDQDINYRCRYALGTAEVVMLVPVTETINGEYQLSRRRPRTIVLHSDVSEPHFIGFSEGGRIEIRSTDLDQALLVINPTTGALHSVQATRKADEK